MKMKARIINSAMASVMALTMIAGTGAMNVGAKTISFNTSFKTGYNNSATIARNNYNKASYVRLKFDTGSRYTVYVRFLDWNGRAVWTNGYRNVNTYTYDRWRGMRMYLGTNVRKITARTSGGWNGMQIIADGNCRVD